MATTAHKSTWKPAVAKAGLLGNYSTGGPWPVVSCLFCGGGAPFVFAAPLFIPGMVGPLN